MRELHIQYSKVKKFRGYIFQFKIHSFSGHLRNIQGVCLHSIYQGTSQLVNLNLFQHSFVWKTTKASEYLFHIIGTICTYKYIKYAQMHTYITQWLDRVFGGLRYRGYDVQRGYTVGRKLRNVISEKSLQYEVQLMDGKMVGSMQAVCQHEHKRLF